jgi:hypothetical protein
MKAINEGLDEIARGIGQSPKVEGCRRSLLKALDDAAGELRRVGAELATESPDSLEAIQESLSAAGKNRREALKPLTEDLTEAARALMNKNVAGTQEGLDDIAQDLEGLDEEIYAQESTLDQLAKGEREGQDGHVPGAQYRTRATSPRQPATGWPSPVEVGVCARRGPLITLEAQLQEEGLKSMPTAGIKRTDVERQAIGAFKALTNKTWLEPTAVQRCVEPRRNAVAIRLLIKTFLNLLFNPRINK